MSHIKRKIKYSEEGNYGNVDEKYLYCDMNGCNDITTFYYEDGTSIFSFNDTLNNNLVDAIINIIKDNSNVEIWNGEFNNKNYEKIK